MWQSLKKATPKGVIWTRLEARIGAGMPDINGVVAEGEFWIESKVCKTKKYKTEGLWRPSQISWQNNRSTLYPNVWNVVSHPAKEVIYLYNANKIIALNSDETPPVPDMVLTYPVVWQDMMDYIRERLTNLGSVMDRECAHV
jgi:hypothetical protein